MGLSLAATCVAAQGPPVDPQLTERQSSMEARFGVEPMQALLDRGDQAYRAFFIDGYNLDLGVVTARRRQAGPAEIEVVALPSSRAKRAERFTAPLSESAWEDLELRSRYFHRDLTPAPEPTAPEGYEIIPICLHPWSVIAEAVEPGAEDFPPMRRKAQSACDDALAYVFGIELAKTAARATPACDPMRDGFGRVFEGFARCATAR